MGFVNVQGGQVYTAIVFGLLSQKKQMEEIPNKIRNKMEAIAEINLLREND
jgi:hypothetical protein